MQQEPVSVHRQPYTPEEIQAIERMLPRAKARAARLAPMTMAERVEAERLAAELRAARSRRRGAAGDWTPQYSCC